MSSEETAPIQVALRREADALAPTFAKFEEICLNTGARLGEATPGLSALARQFESVSNGLDGAAILTASRDLEAIADELKRAAQLVDEESRALPELVKVNQAIGVQIVALLGFIRTVAALVFTLKIESAQVKDDAQEMVVFAEALQRTADEARRTLDEYHAAHGKLEAILKAAAAAQGEFQRQHQGALAAIANEIVESLGGVADRRGRTVTALQDVSRLADDIGQRISQCLAALQIGDSTRQRVEHVCDALRLAEMAIAGAPFKLGRKAVGEGWSGDPRRLAARVAHLQAAQIEAARSDYEHESATISTGLERLGERAQELEGRGVALFGASDAAGGSFLEQLERKLSAARAFVEGCRNARAGVDRATATVGSTMTDLDARTGHLLEIASAVSMIGTNASLKSARLGDAGKGIMLVAQELRTFGDRIRRTTDELPASLNRVMTFVGRFAEARRELDAQRLAQLDSRMLAAIQTFEESGKEMSAALTRLRSEAGSVRTALDRAVAALGSQTEVAPMLQNAASAVRTAALSLADARTRAPDVDGFLDDWLRPAYSMTSERQVHDALTGHVAPAKENAVPTPQGSGDLAGAFML